MLSDVVKEQPLIQRLTCREAEVMGLRAAGYSYKEVGARLFISPRTVGFHLTNVYEKLGVKNITQAVNLCRK